MYYQEYITPKSVQLQLWGSVTAELHITWWTRTHYLHSVHDRYRVVRSPALGTTLLWSLCTVCQHNLLNHVTWCEVLPSQHSIEVVQAVAHSWGLCTLRIIVRWDFALGMEILSLYPQSLLVKLTTLGNLGYHHGFFCQSVQVVGASALLISLQLVSECANWWSGEVVTGAKPLKESTSFIICAVRLIL